MQSALSVVGVKRESGAEPNPPSSPNRGELALAAMDEVDAMMAYWDQDQICQFANKSYYDWFGKTVDEMLGITLKALLGPLYELNLPYIQKAYAGEKQVFEREIRTPDGHVRNSLATYTPHRAGGVVRGIFAHVADVSVLKRTEIELREAKANAEHMATHDFLTGLPNRALLKDRIAQALMLAKRAGQMVAGISLDLDDFKRINDSYGHPAGDYLLIEVAARIQGALREVDTVTRMGGDEFFLLIQGVDSELQVEMMAERILENVNKPLALGQAVVHPACSMGVVVSMPDKVEPEQLILESDRALLKAKSLGKNQFVVAH